MGPTGTRYGNRYRLFKVGVTATDNRLFVGAVLYRYRTGMPWRDLPERFGDGVQVHRRFSRWAKNGVWERALCPLKKRDGDYRGNDFIAFVLAGDAESRPITAYTGVVISRISDRVDAIRNGTGQPNVLWAEALEGITRREFSDLDALLDVYTVDQGQARERTW